MEPCRPMSKTREDLEGMVAYWEQEAAQSARREVELKEKFMALEAKLDAIHGIARVHASCQVGCDALLDIAEVLDLE